MAAQVQDSNFLTRRGIVVAVIIVLHVLAFMGFDDQWHWRDDNFRWLVPPGVWTTITWELPERQEFRELGLKLTAGTSAVSIGQFEIAP